MAENRGRVGKESRAKCQKSVANVFSANTKEKREKRKRAGDLADASRHQNGPQTNSEERGQTGKRTACRRNREEEEPTTSGLCREGGIIFQGKEPGGKKKKGGRREDDFKKCRSAGKRWARGYMTRIQRIGKLLDQRTVKRRGKASQRRGHKRAKGRNKGRKVFWGGKGRRSTERRIMFLKGAAGRHKEREA